MPCNCDHLEPNKHERESVRVLKHLRELRVRKGDIPYYGNVDTLSEDTAKLCAVYTEIEDVSDYSLELQIWWRDHQEADAEKLK